MKYTPSSNWKVKVFRFYYPYLKVNLIKEIYNQPVGYESLRLMSHPQYILYKCKPETFHPLMLYPVSWLDWEQDYPLVEEFWPDQTPEGWQDARQQGFRYCAVIEHNKIQAFGAVWRYSEDAWEVASVYTRPETCEKGYSKAVVTFVTTYIMDTFLFIYS